VGSNLPERDFLGVRWKGRIANAPAGAFSAGGWRHSARDFRTVANGHELTQAHYLAGAEDAPV
jgi:hypothetical protein